MSKPLGIRLSKDIEEKVRKMMFNESRGFSNCINRICQIHFQKEKKNDWKPVIN